MYGLLLILILNKRTRIIKNPIILLYMLINGYMIESASLFFISLI